MEEETREYKNKVLFLRKSKKGNHLYAFDRDGILGKGVDSIVLNVSDVKQLLSGETEWIKASAMAK
jgi:hypothetical protein